METNQIIIIPKMSKFERDMQRLGLNESKLLDFYKNEGIDYSRITESHERQKEGLEKMKKLFTGAVIIKRDDLKKGLAKKYSLIISFGGDNHFQYISHFLEDTPILGVNSDPIKSEGALASVTINNLEESAKHILNDNFKLEEWPRLEMSVNGARINQPAISEIFIGEESRFNMSRHILAINKSSEEQKGSGLIICTGAGSTGWYNSASRYLFSNGDKFSKTANEARFILTEPYRGKLSSYKMLNGSVKKGQELEITSLSDSQAILSIDSLELIKLKEGSKIKIIIGRPLKVVKIK